MRAEVTEFKTGVVYDQGGVKVTAFEVDHGELLKPAVGFRVDYAGRSVTVSGDTRFSENLIDTRRAPTCWSIRWPLRAKRC